MAEGTDYPVDSPARQMVRRSSLIMPVNVPAFVEKAHLRGADAICLDLEDSVPPREKDRARTLIKDAIPKAARGGADVTVRINRPWDLARPGRHQLPKAGDRRGAPTARSDHRALRARARHPRGHDQDRHLHRERG